MFGISAHLLHSNNLLDGTGKINKPTSPNRIAGGQNETRMTKIIIKYNYFVSIILCNYASNACSYKIQFSLNILLQT